jgi:hypothetical protein
MSHSFPEYGCRIPGWDFYLGWPSFQFGTSRSFCLRRDHVESVQRLHSAFKELEPIPQYKATAKLAGFLQGVRPS